MNGYLSGFKIFNLYTRKIFEEWNKLTDWDSYYNNRVISTILDIINENNSGLDKDYPSKRPENGKIIIFCKYRTNEIYDFLVENHISTGLLISGNYKSTYWVQDREEHCIDRKSMIKLFANDDDAKEGSIKVLINNAILTEGFDEPKITDMILLYDTESRIRMTQIIGRGLRPFDENRACAIYNFANAGIVKKLYDGNDGVAKPNVLRNISEQINEHITVVDGKLITNRDINKNNKVQDAYSKHAIYEYVEAVELNKVFSIAGVLIDDDGNERIISLEELNSLNEGNILTRLGMEFNKSLYDLYQKYKKNSSEIKTFVKYLELYGRYRSYSDSDKTNANEIVSCIHQNIEKIVVLLKKGNSISVAIKEVLGLSENSDNSDVNKYKKWILYRLMLNKSLKEK